MNLNYVIIRFQVFKQNHIFQLIIIHTEKCIYKEIISINLKKNIYYLSISTIKILLTILFAIELYVKVVSCSIKMIKLKNQIATTAQDIVAVLVARNQLI